MLIECRARRVAHDPRIGRKDRDIGTKSKLFGMIYHFRPQPELVAEGLDGEAHICVVDDARAIKRFLIEIPEQFNELGKPPRIPPAPAAVQGQVETTTELIDSDDALGDKDAKPIDPLAGAKRLHQQWLDEMLSAPVKQVAKDLHRYNPDELTQLLDAEKAGKNRKSMIEVLAVAKDGAEAQAAAVPDLPPDDDISLE